MVETRVDVAVLGGGFCGLSTAFHLSRAGLSVAVIEKESELAGLARSHQLDDYSIEVFYHHYFTHDEDVISMLSVLGLGDRFVTRRASQGIFSAGRLYPFSTPIDLLSFPNIPFRERLKLGLVSQKLLGARDDLEALSAKEWICRYVGQSAYENLFQPLCWAKFGCDGTDVSAAFVRGRMFARGASRTRFKWNERLAYVQGGSDAFVKQLVAALPADQVELVCSASVSGIKRESDTFLTTFTAAGAKHAIRSTYAVSTIPTPVLPRIAQGFPQAFLQTLEQIPYRGVIVATFGLCRSVSSHYWTTVIDKSLPFNVLIEHTRLHAPVHYRGDHLLYVGRYATPGEKFWSLDDQEVMTLYRAGLTRMFPALREADIRWSRIARDGFATPVFTTEYSGWLAGLKKAVPRFFLGGTLTTFPDSRNVNAALRIGRDIARQIVRTQRGA